MTKPSMKVVRCVFKQDADCCQSGEQEIVVQEDNGGLKDDDSFYVIETDRWAFNSIDDVVEMLRRAGCREKRMEGDTTAAPIGERVEVI